MSQENAEIVRRVFEAWTAEGAEGVRPMLSEEIEVHDPPQFPDASVHLGVDAALARYGDWRQALGDMAATVEEIIPADDEFVVILRIQVLGPRSGIEIVQEVAQVVRVADRKLQRQRVFLSRAEALEAAGLSE
jgi:ketosteroid isomerase-like protein